MMKKFSARKNLQFNLINKFLIDLPTPVNINFWWNMGSILGLLFLMQLVSGVFLSMNYNSSISSFSSVINLEINNTEGFTLRSVHVVGASFIFIFMYFHMFRGLFYRSYVINKMTWTTGVTIFLMMMVTAFLGYVLPWGQMSFWAATVITNMMSAIPLIGKNLVIWIWGGFSVGLPTLNRFYTFHFVFPFILLMLIMLHLLFLHVKGSNNPLLIPSNCYKVSFHSLYTYKDLYGFTVPLFSILLLINQIPDVFNDVSNFIEANPLSTPAHIMPEWYFLFAYGILRSVPNKLGGVIGMLMSILILYSLIKSMKMPNNSINKVMSTIVAMNFIILSFVGSQLVEQPFIVLGQIFSFLYFMIFIIMYFI